MLEEASQACETMLMREPSGLRRKASLVATSETYVADIANFLVS
jgi:hypothetical protein